ncbi:MAG TPA: DUF1080 domain-containing protein [Planctomycetota bacterium]|nr:DUF1080 domain-containing protein [Planctomycetota bacterium]
MAALLALALWTAQEAAEPPWEPNPGWKIEGGVIERVDRGGNLWTRETYGDFVLTLEFKIPRGGNSGLIFRSRDNVEHQIEIVDDAGRPPHAGSTGSIFRRCAPRENRTKPAGEWNAVELEVRGRAVSLTLNGARVIENAIVDDLPFRGPIGLQDHGTPLWFRNVRVRRLDPRPPLPEDAPPLGAAETRGFMMNLARYVFEHHLKKDERSEQRGMIYEYVDVTKKDGPGRWVQGEALDTMHDGAWFGAALGTAGRVTGDPFYEEFLTRWVLPFYLKMLLHSDTLFSAKRDDSAPDAPRFDREHLFQEGEKGFVPYWWDDGASVSLEEVRRRTGRPAFPATDRLAGKPNPEMRLDGWSHGSSNHLAQDVAALLLVSWLGLREKDPARAAEIAEAARRLQECRARHGAPAIPMCLAAAGLTGRDAALLRRIPEPREGDPANPTTRCLAPRDMERRESTPGFADDQEYHYYAGIARAGGEMPHPLAFRLVYDAYTIPMLFRYACDHRAVPPGINRFDLAGLAFKGGKPEAYGSDRPAPFGSRLGPQNMVVSGWALQALRAFPGLWEERYRRSFSEDVRVRFLDEGRSYTINAKPEPGASDPIVLGEVTLRLVSHRNALLAAGTARGDSAVIRLHGHPDSGAPWAKVTIRKDRSCVAVNDRGEPLRVAGHALPAEGGFEFEFALPYTVVKDQRPWANGLEHARYAVSVGEARRTFYLASTEEQVIRALERELGRGLGTWERMFAERGYIPTGLLGRWEHLSDSGGYAHLLKAGAQWLLYLEKRRDWELHRVPRVE